MPFHTMPAPLRASFRGSHVLVIGAGYLGKRVIAAIVAAGCQVTATSRSDSKRGSIEKLGARHVVAQFPGDTVPPDVDLVVCCIAGSDTAMRQAPLAIAAGTDAPLIFVSSTGVYASDDGTWVEESALTQGELSETERVLLQRPRTTVLRCGGLYGGERNPVAWMHDAERRARLGKGNADAWMNWVRVEDAARAVLAACEREETGSFNIAHAPVTRRNFYDLAAQHAGVEPLTFTGTGGMGKRVATQRARDVLELTLNYPTHAEGLSLPTSAVVE